MEVSLIPPGIRSMLPEMKTGAVSAPVRLEDGWHILKLHDVREARRASFEQVRDEFAVRMRAEMAVTKRKQYVERPLQENPVAINEIELNKWLEKMAK